MDMKDLCDRRVVTKMINDLMVERRDEFNESTAKMSKLANQSVAIGGSSHNNFQLLVDEIRSMGLKKKTHVTKCQALKCM